MTHIGHCTTTEIVPSSEGHVRVMRMIRTFSFWPEPKIPIEPFRNRWSVSWFFRVLRPHRAIGPVMYFTERSYCTCVYPIHYWCHRAIEIPWNQVSDHATFLSHVNSLLS